MLKVLAQVRNWFQFSVLICHAGRCQSPAEGLDPSPMLLVRTRQSQSGPPLIVVDLGRVLHS